MWKTAFAKFIYLIVAVALLLTVAVSFWTERNLEYWLSRLKGVPVDVPWWMAFVLTLVLNAIILAVNIVGELLRLVY